MSLKEIIDKEIKNAMLNKNKIRLIALRSIKSSILLHEKSDSGTNTLTKEKEMQILMKNVKQRNDSKELYVKEGRKDLAKIEDDEIKIISEFLPNQMSDKEIHIEIEKIIKENDARDIKDMGKIMGIASKKFSGQADNSLIASIVKSKLT
tara:strand:+ start:974 stop:1423 length:450 start_codon:yes stop_codon:yes gene_type:complete